MANSIYPCLWYDNQAEEAAKFYCTLFPNSRIVSTNPMVTIFELNGTKFMGLNGGPHFQFNPSVSFVIHCETQAEIDHYWLGLIADSGKESMCGWLVDKYGMSWQVVPSILGELLSDPTRSQRVSEAFMKMKKFDIQALLDA